jgi:hypothetical protein
MPTSTLFTSRAILLSSSLWTPKGSPSNPTKLEFYAQIGFTEADLKSPDGKRLTEAVLDLCHRVGGPNVEDQIKAGRFRFPIRRIDPEKLAQKGWPKTLVRDVNMKSGQDYPPRIVDAHVDPIIDRSEIYPGCIVRASVTLFSYPQGKSPIPGVSIALSNIQKLDDGPRLAGARGDGSEFGEAGGLAAPDEDDINDLI